MNMHHRQETQHDDLDASAGIATGVAVGALVWIVLIGSLLLWLHS